MKPFEAIIVATKLFTMAKEKNSIHSGRFPFGIKKVGISKTYSLSKFE
jgi:hypothetical protein